MRLRPRHPIVTADDLFFLSFFILFFFLFIILLILPFSTEICAGFYSMEKARSI